MVNKSKNRWNWKWVWFLVILVTWLLVWKVYGGFLVVNKEIETDISIERKLTITPTPTTSIYENEDI